MPVLLLSLRKLKVQDVNYYTVKTIYLLQYPDCTIDSKKFQMKILFIYKIYITCDKDHNIKYNLKLA